MNASEVKKGDRVVFVTGDNVHFNGIALSDAKIGVHPGVKRAGIFLDIVYLDGSGSQVKVLSAPVLKDAVTTEDLNKIVEFDHAARSRDHRRKSLEAFGGDVTVYDLRKEFQEMKQSCGWRSFGFGGLIGKYPLDTAGDSKNQLQEAAVLGLQTQLESVTAERNALKARIDELTLERDTLKEELAKSESEKAEFQQRLTSAAEVALSETPLIEAGLAAGAKPDTTVYSSEGKQAQDAASMHSQIETTAQTEASAQASSDAQTE